MARVFSDGAGWNGKQCRYAIFFEETGESIIHRFTKYHTNNEMEYIAVLEALKLAKDRDTIFTDSQLVVGQCTGVYNIKAYHLKPLCKRVKQMLKDKNIQLVWVRRENNKAGILLEKTPWMKQK